MDYAKAAPEIKTGDVLAWTHRSWSSWYDWQIQIVRFFTQSEYSHVAIAYVDDDGVLHMFEAVSKGVQLVKVEGSVPLYWLPTGLDQCREKIRDAAMPHLGEQYSKINAIYAFLFKIKPGADKWWECAEWAQFLLQAAGLTIDCDSTPSHVVEWLQDELGCPLFPVKGAAC